MDEEMHHGFTVSMYCTVLPQLVEQAQDNVSRNMQDDSEILDNGGTYSHLLLHYLQLHLAGQLHTSTEQCDTQRLVRVDTLPVSMYILG